MGVYLKVDISKAVNDLNALGRRVRPSVFNTAMARAINRATTSGKTHGSRQIRSKYKILKKDLDPKMKRTAANRSRLTSSVITWGTPMSLRNFKPVQRKKGVSVNIAGKRKVLKHAFLAPAYPRSRTERFQGPGMLQVFIRGKYGQHGVEYVPGGRLPIVKVVTVSQGVMFSNPTVIEETRDQIDRVLTNRLPHEINAILSGFASA